MFILTWSKEGFYKKGDILCYKWRWIMDMNIEKIIRKMSTEDLGYKKEYEFPIVRFRVKTNLKPVCKYIDEYQHNSSKVFLNKEEFEIIHKSNKNVLQMIIKEVENFTASDIILIHKNQKYVRKYELNGYKICIDVDGEYVTIVERNQIYIFTSGNKDGSYVLRCMRELLIRTYENNGFVLLHGAAFEKTNLGILICGDKAKGKTTTLIRGLEKGGNYIANDRVAVGIIADEVVMFYLPLAVRIGYGTVINSCMLNEFISRNQKYKREQNEKFFYDNNREKIGSNIKVELTVKELCEIFDANAIDQCVLKMCIFPEFNLKYSDEQNNDINANQVLRILKNNVMTPNDANWCNPWLLERKYSPEEMEENKEKIITHILKNCKMYVFKFGKEK